LKALTGPDHRRQRMAALPQRLILAGLAVIAVAAIIAVVSLAVPPQVIAVDAGDESPHAGLTEAGMAVLVSGAQPAEHDPCLHCHVSGSDEGIWTRRAAGWIDARYDLAKPLEKMLQKPVPAYARRWWYCLGGITAFLFVVQAVTGIMLAFYYKPTPEAAYSSIQYIESEVFFGAGLRAIHHWAANGMVVMCIAHMARVFINGAYKAPRELNWVGGMLLLIATLAFGFTGYLLPWDQRAFWATTVGTEIAGSLPIIGDPALVFSRVGWGVGELTLSRFYAVHVLVLPAVTVALMGLHFLMVRRLGIARPL
jgi:hypothetical protein